MPILSRVGRKRPEAVAQIAGMYLILVAGAVTMVYPFAVMLGTSITGVADYERYEAVPRYLYDGRMRFLKYLADRYSRDFDTFSCNYRSEKWANWFALSDDADFMAECVPFSGDIEADPGKFAPIVEDWHAYLESVAPEDRVVCFRADANREYRTFLREKYSAKYLEVSKADPNALREDELESHALELLNRTYGRGILRFSDLWLHTDLYLNRTWFPPKDKEQCRDWLEFKSRVPPGRLTVVAGQLIWQNYLSRRYGIVSALNDEWKTGYEAFAEVRLCLAPPRGPVPREVWSDFVVKAWPLRLIRLKVGPERFRAFLARRYGAVEVYNRRTERRYGAFADVPFTAVAPEHPLERAEWMAFVDADVPAEERELICPEADYPAFLRKRYGSIGDMNAAYGTRYEDFAEAPLPFPIVDYCDYHARRGPIFWKFVTGNYAEVLDFIFVRGDALLNTAILVALTIVSTLVVNPLAAYALSRFSLRSSQKILLFLVATMAFPAEVAMIPGFLLMRDLGMLNTFAALVIPGLANGYAIFLLKGFFDGLPRELYEAATMDGASELRMFRVITLPLSKPILAVTALGAFTAAYGSFMWPFLVCQDPKMWTLMVWLYQFQMWRSSEPYVVMASLVVAAIPTLLVFVFCQRIILRGIIIPVMK